MAKKYQAVKNKISPITIASIVLFILVIVLLIIFLQPSREKQFFMAYKEQAQMQGVAFNDKKFGENHQFRFIDSIEDRWFGLQPGLLSIARRNEISIVFFGTAKDNNSIIQIQNVHGLLFGVESLAVEQPSWKTSDLYIQLGSKITLYHFDLNVDGANDLVDRLNDEFGTEISITALPLVVAFINGQIVEYLNPTVDAATGITKTRQFYNDILASEAAQALL